MDGWNNGWNVTKKRKEEILLGGADVAVWYVTVGVIMADEMRFDS
jgi:hypothetical protein